MIKSKIKPMLPLLVMLLKFICGLLFVTYTVAPIYNKFLNLAFLDAYKQPGGVQDWMLGDLAAISTIVCYVMAYVIIKICCAAFEVEVGNDKKTEAQNKTQDQKISEDVREA